MDTLRQDLLYALRILRKERAYSAAVVLTLAVCLGANTAIFTVIRSVLLRPLPYPQPERLISSYDSYPGAGVERAGTSVPNYADRRAMIDVFSSAALYQFDDYKVGEGARAENVPAMNVTPSFFDVLGAAAARGRLFTEAEGTPGRNRVTLVAVGLAGGIAGAIALGGAIAAQLYGVGSLDPLVMGSAVVILAVTSFAACMGPARRAVQVSPLVALSRQ